MKQYQNIKILERFIRKKLMNEGVVEAGITKELDKIFRIYYKIDLMKLKEIEKQKLLLF